MGRIIPYIMENKPNLWNHQPVYVYIYSSYMLMAMLYIYRMAMLQFKEL